MTMEFIESIGGRPMSGYSVDKFVDTKTGDVRLDKKFNDHVMVTKLLSPDNYAGIMKLYPPQYKRLAWVLSVVFDHSYLDYGTEQVKNTRAQFVPEEIDPPAHYNFYTGWTP